MLEVHRIWVAPIKNNPKSNQSMSHHLFYCSGLSTKDGTSETTVWFSLFLTFLVHCVFTLSGIEFNEFDRSRWSIFHCPVQIFNHGFKVKNSGWFKSGILNLNWLVGNSATSSIHPPRFLYKSKLNRPEENSN